MIRKIIKIDEERCNGCGLCATACHEGAIAMVDGKARLMRDDFCDGLGDCLPVCPTGAISFEEREAAAYDEAAVKANIAATEHNHHDGGCQSSVPCSMQKNQSVQPDMDIGNSELNQWPVQIKLTPITAPYFENSNLLIAADCAAYAYAAFHKEFMRNKITLIGCPKLDRADYTEKLTAIIKSNTIKSVTVVRMEVPCCKGIEQAVITALRDSGEMIPWQVAVISRDGRILR